MSSGNFWNEGEDSGEIAEINVVPLVDVLLVLLVIFMITAPIITHTLDVRLPRSNVAPSARTDRTLIVTVDRRGVVALNDKVVGPLRNRAAMRRFEVAVKHWKTSRGDSPAYLRADRAISYGAVIQVMAILKRLGVADVGLMIEREGS